MENGNKDFNFEKALEAIQNGQPLREKSIPVLLKILQRIDVMVKAKRRSNRSTEILSCPRHEIEPGLKRLSSSRNIKQL